VNRDVADVAGLSGSLTKPVRQSELFNCLTAGLSMQGDENLTEPAPDVDVPTGQGHLLLVEDNSMNQLVATSLLAKLGYEVEVASNGIEALEAMADAEYDAVLMDCQMPEMDGYAATREIRRREGGTRHTPVIAMTAAAMQGDRDACIAAGMDDYLTKPIRPRELAEALMQWIDSAGPSRPVAEPAAAPEPAPAPAPSEGDDAARLDGERLSILRELDDGDGVLIASIVDEFTAESGRQLDLLRAAVADGDPQAMEQAAHSMKGSSANLGATRLAELTAQLEALGRARTFADAPPLIDEVARELERVAVALAQVMAVG
jgi:CheY-like chemotaxis protein/HPt (histidine-containing phosphotransfer) domain-containing protein